MTRRTLAWRVIDLDPLIAGAIEECNGEEGVRPVPVVPLRLPRRAATPYRYRRRNHDQTASKGPGEDTGKRLEITDRVAIRY
jgi:hypothetical protein